MFSYEYPRPAVTADCVVIGIDAERRRRVLLIRRRHDPYKDCWAFPGGFLEMDETLEQCARRELAEETCISAPLRFEELKSFSTVDRDPRGRTITVAFLAVVDLASLPPARGGDDAAEARWFDLDQLPNLAFDHNEILRCALQRLQQ